MIFQTNKFGAFINTALRKTELTVTSGDSKVGATGVTLKFQMYLTNGIPMNGKIYIKLPTAMPISTTCAYTITDQLSTSNCKSTAIECPSQIP